MKLKAKISLFTLFIIILVVVMLSYSLFVYEKNARIEDIRVEQQTVFKTFKNLSMESLLLRDEVLLLNNMKALKNTFRGIEYINFIGSNGRILYTDKNMSERAESRSEQDVSKRETFKAGFNKIITEVSGPVYFENERFGIAQVGFSQRYYDKFISKKISKARNRIIVMSVIVLFFGLLCSLLISKTLADPIKKLAEGANAIGGGDLDIQIDIRSQDELGMLAEEFNQMADRLAELDRAKDEFVNAVSHELRTPLSAIEGYIDFLLDAGDSIPPEKKLKALNIMKSSSHRLAQFINDVLDIAKLKSGRMTYELEPVAPRDLIETVVGLLKSVAEQKNIEMTVSVPEGIPQIMADADRVNQVITNLAGNALKFTPDKGKIIVGAEQVEEGFVRIYVRDTGPGIPEDDLRKIFMQFEQSESTRNIKGPKGTGLGLAIAEGIVKSHGGQIWVESTVGVGTTFYFTMSEKKADV